MAGKYYMAPGRKDTHTVIRQEKRTQTENKKETTTRDHTLRMRVTLRDMPVPNDIGPLKDVRWAAGDNDWYIETEAGEVYWWNGKHWRYCPQGAR